MLGGKIIKSEKREYGNAKIFEILKSRLTKNFFNKKHNIVWMSHSDEVIKAPKGFKIIARSRKSNKSILENQKKKIYTFQFHPEVYHTKNGKKIIENFIFLICKCKKNWTSKNKIKEISNYIKREVKKEKVLCALSGGVDIVYLHLCCIKSKKKLNLCIYRHWFYETK